MKPRIHVALPVRDAAHTVEAAAASVLGSRGVDVELTCVDDGSRDGSAERLAALAGRDARVVVRRTDARGICAALREATAMSDAPLVARMDADDEMHPDRLAEQAAFLERHEDVSLVGCGVESFREGGLLEGYALYSEWANGLVEHEAIVRECLIDCPVPHPTWMLRREALVDVGGYRDVPWPEDLDVLYRLLAAGRRLGKVDRVLHRWRDHDARLSRVDPRYDREAFTRVKAHFVARIFPMPAAVVWGAGRTGRRLVKWLEAEGVKTRVLLDINPARIGSSWRGIPILAPDALDEAAAAWRDEGLRVLGAVASRGARGQIRAKLTSVGLTEGEHFLMVA